MLLQIFKFIKDNIDTTILNRMLKDIKVFYVPKFVI
jgi:hypothetical protein